MKKQHLYRTSAILLFLCILLGILPQHVLQTNAAENGSLPKEGVLYTLSCADSNKQIFSLGFPLINAFNVDKSTYGYLSFFPYDKHNKTDLNCAFSFKEIQDGYYTIIPATAPDICLQVSTESSYKTVKGNKFDNKPEQLWKITPSKEGIEISNAAFPDLILGLRDGVSAGDTLIAMTTGEWVITLEEAQIVFPEHRIHVKAPDFWTPCIASSSFGFVFMPKEEDGWYSYYYYEDHIMIENLAISSPMAQIFPPDFKIHLVVEDPNKDYWVVISDDPNVDGDLSYKLYDYNPDEEPPKTADPVTLAVPAFILLTSTIAIAWLHHRRKTA